MNRKIQERISQLENEEAEIRNELKKASDEVKSKIASVALSGITSWILYRIYKKFFRLGKGENQAVKQNGSGLSPSTTNQLVSLVVSLLGSFIYARIKALKKKTPPLNDK